ncbi:5'-3' exonuclease PLD3-like isoform X1 [Gopherus flavomarginatus]|uniref:5'-3' exonuclease PLD3-like isoform X1 n=2 Tax=Gopherus flavomarginatus TaxID=286002 RepID=UPI0021CBA82B|nr:5'-3' exonuclease PLD3-like isoform X1 [Gopherus flavomarginatus]
MSTGAGAGPASSFPATLPPGMRRRGSLRAGTPVRRSTRLAQSSAEEPVLREVSSAEGGSLPLVLQPRASIKAHKLHLTPARDPSPTPASDPTPMPDLEPSAGSALEPLPILTREPPLPQLKDEPTRTAMKRGLSRKPAAKLEASRSNRRVALDQDAHLSPYVRLKRLQISEEDGEKEELFPTRSESSGEKEKLNLDWQEFRDERAQLQVLETALPGSETATVTEIMAPRLQGKAASNTPRLQGTAIWLQGGAASSFPRLQGGAPRLQDRAQISTPRWQSAAPRLQSVAPGTPGLTETDTLRVRRVAHGTPGLAMWTETAALRAPAPRPKSPRKPSKHFLFSSTCCILLPFLLILGFSGWFLWEHSSPVSVLGLMEQWQLGWSHVASLWREPEEECSSQCSLVLVESIPVGLDYNYSSPRHLPIFQAWMDLLDAANRSVDIAAFYFTLRDSDMKEEEPSSWQGRQVLEKLQDLPSRGVKLNIAVNSPQKSDRDTEELASKGADIKYVELERLTGGIVHTKFWVVDGKHVYIGSANMDWRSLTQVKELGAVLYNCSCVAGDLHRIFAMYHALGGQGASLPTMWPAYVSAKSSLSHPLKLQLNGSSAELYLSSSPPALCSTGRTPDLTAIVSTIQDAQAFVYISVMDYVPQCTFCQPKRFWPVIDDALRAAACNRHVKVRLLISCWQHSDQSMFLFLESLSVLSQEPLGCPIEVKLFVVSASVEQKRIPFSRVNHNKYMVTDRLAYIGTSNWSEDYFTNTAGVGLIINQSEAAPGVTQLTLREQLEAVFHRDWSSSYSQPLSPKPSCAAKN